jgi:hypothetical protein
MNLKTLLDTPPWEWPADAGKIFQDVLANRQANESDRLIAAELGGDLVVIDDRLANSLVAVVGNHDEPEELRAKAAISLGPVLETAWTDGFDDPDAVPISERTFHGIQAAFHKLYLDPGTPQEVRRRILEASVRAPESWHENAIRAAYSSKNKDWMLTAVFAMRWIRGFDTQILESLKSTDPQIHYEAVQAAGDAELEPAWPHILALLEDSATPKDLLIAAIGAVSGIRPLEAREILSDLVDSDDEDISEAAAEAISISEATSFDEDEEEDDEDEGDVGKWIN